MNNRMRSQWVRVAIALLLTGAMQLAMAQAQPQRFATVHKTAGVVQASHPASGTTRTIHPGDVVYVGEHIRASVNGEAVLRTDDAGVIAVRPNGYFVVDQFKAQGQANDQFSMRILAGALRMITGWVGVVNKPGYRIATPTATVGIRGTDHEPYVLSPELALQLRQPAGTYNLVNKGATYLDSAGAQVEISAGRVGFAPATDGGRSRALMTALLPVLLERVPNFFVPGSFDAELENLAAQDLSAAAKEHKFAAVMEASPAQSVSDRAADPPAPAVLGTPMANNKPVAKDACNAQAIAVQWLAELDAALVARDSNAFIAQFAAQVDVQAQVKGANGTMTALRFTRDEMVKSTFASLAQLTEFSSRRPVVVGKRANAQRNGTCGRLEVESVVIESGVRAASPYRLESQESFTLERRGGRWVAVRALTKQR